MFLVLETYVNIYWIVNNDQITIHNLLPILNKYGCMCVCVCLCGVGMCALCNTCV